MDDPNRALRRDDLPFLDDPWDFLEDLFDEPWRGIFCISHTFCYTHGEWWSVGARILIR